ncbi:class C sortase [Clostridium perfringens]|uniref:Sortase family protein n=1 Tax=Clostridium perfringens D str. JGS1721 TaxID=488537 RepID=B1V1A4_CLOPF|nr:class C sortase [Clostridium perfringens]EDT72412.1 sortase family protein [Clostridium perfringens D str. JGS1721]MCC5421025.1 class C sortase [Clostridium perfringens]MCC5431607.1 class C sortase [Clostridium perfringens]MCC5434555.1 class C sortase [Clostridium perfringens]MCC5435960.1 class C sortase [Clostridium perfringens]
MNFDIALDFLKRLKKIYFSILILITLIALGFLLYPSFSNYINNKFAVSTISDYTEKINNVKDEEVDDLIKNINKYNYDLFNGTAENQLPEYLNIHEGDVLGYIEIPSINIKLPIYYGTSVDILKKGVGVLEGTSLPVGGENTHSVLSAHTGLANQKLFTDIDKLKDGDVFYLHILKKDLAYKVNQIKVVHPDEIDELKISDEKDYVTLLTCYPYGINTERLLVRGERTDLSPSNVEQVQKEISTFNHSNENLILIVIILISVLIIIFLLFLIMKFKGKNKSR